MSLHHALVALLYGRVFSIDDRCWTVVDLDAEGRVLMYQGFHDDTPGVLLHRWFDAGVLAQAERERMDGF